MSEICLQVLTDFRAGGIANNQAVIKYIFVVRRSCVNFLTVLGKAIISPNCWHAKVSAQSFYFIFSSCLSLLFLNWRYFLNPQMMRPKGLQGSTGLLWWPWGGCVLVAGAPAWSLLHGHAARPCCEPHGASRDSSAPEWTDSDCQEQDKSLFSMFRGLSILW